MLDELILELKQKDVHLYLNNGKLRCKAPPSVLTPNLKAALKDHKTELMEYLLEAQYYEHSSPIPVSRSGHLPLSFAQQRIFTLMQFDPHSVVYNIPSALVLIGKLDVEALKNSINTIVRRHEILRTIFTITNGQMYQVIAPILNLDINIVNLSDISDDLRKLEAEKYIKADIQSPFNLTQGPLVRTTLLSLGARTASDNLEHILLFTLHHIVSDGWSAGVLIREFLMLYEAFKLEKASPLSELKIQYADYAVWQREWLQGERLAHQLIYWKQQLSDAPAILELPTDRPRSTEQNYQGASYRFTLPQAIVEQLKVLSQQENVTLFMVLLASFNVLLYRYSNQKDICVGTPFANRNQVEIEELIGLFVNTLVLRIGLSGDLTFIQLLRKTKEVCLGAQAHQDLPFEKLVEELVPVRDISHNPLFQVMFALQNTTSIQLELPELEIRQLEIQTQTAKFDLFLHVIESKDALDSVIEYRTDLFETETISRMAGHFQRLLEAIVSAPEKRLADLPLLTDSERNQVLLDWNATDVEYTQIVCIHQLFEAQVKNSPDTVAVVFEDQRLTYDQLNIKANQLAHYLCAQGVGPEELVGICVERSLEMVIGILGILKAGGTYVPIDPNYPQERITLILEDAQPVITLIHKPTCGIVPEGVRFFDMEAEWIVIEQCEKENPTDVIFGQNLAYVIYTSGSTGKPKGVGLSHQGIVNRLYWMQHQYLLNEEDRVLQKTPFNFDVSVWEFFWPLMAGARLVVAPPGAHRDSIHMVEIIKQQEITTLHFVPSMLSAFLDAPDVELCGSLKRVICSGEALPANVQNRFFDKFQIQLENLYGPTEASIDVTMHPCKQGGVDASVPIGRPIANMQIYLLDAYLNPVPIGVAGELYIGGVGLARGYQNRSALTAEQFIPNPFSTQPGERLYRSGDLARYSTDGDIEYLGRTDHQVKIRGFRIELGEIEAILLQHGQIKEAVVVVHENNPEDKRLVAYVVDSESVPSIEDLRSLLKTQLPEYMVPATFIFLDSLPLNSNGKIDRKALPTPDTSDQLAHQYIAPRNLTEEILTWIWISVLPVVRVGIDDNFFELGGDSIRSVQVVSLAKGKGFNVSLEQLYRCRTIRELSQVLTQRVQSASIPVALEPFGLIAYEDKAKLSEDIENAYPIASLQAGMIFHNKYNPDAYHVFDSITLQCSFNLEKLTAALDYVFKRHPVLRTTFDFENYSEPLQLVHKQHIVSIKYVDLRHLTSLQQSKILSDWKETERSNYFKVNQLPLIRFHIHQLSGDLFQFSMTEHHAVLDGWSLTSMVNEVFLYYFNLLESNSCDEAADTDTDNGMYKLVAYEKAALVSDQCKDYWMQHLYDFEINGLPQQGTDEIQNEIQNNRWFNSKTIFPLDLSQKLKNLAKQLGVPLKSVLLAAHVRVLSLLYGKRNITTGLVCNVRPDDLGGDSALGVFLNTLPFFHKLKDGSWLELIAQIFDAECELLQARYYPLAALQRMRENEPLFDVIFNYVHYHVGETLLKSSKLQIVDWQAEVLPIFSLEANFTLNALSSNIELELRGINLGPTQLARIRDYFMTILEKMSDEPSAHIAIHSYLNSFERERLLLEWNTTNVVFSQPQSIHQLFEIQVGNSPDAVAVVFEDRRLTYGQLNARANQLAHYLRAQGIGPEMLVGICVERSLEMVIGILGILKSGGAYVPIDPKAPRERLASILKNTQSAMVLTQEKLQGLLPPDVEQFYLDTEWSKIIEEKTDNVVCAALPQHLAYVLYTSGSTGKPKGVSITHHNVVNSTLARLEYYKQPISSFLLLSSMTFDSSIAGLFGTLSQGGCLILPHDDLILDVKHLSQLITSHEVSHLLTVPSLYKAILGQMISARTDSTNSLKVAIVAGEPCHQDLVALHHQLLPQVQLFNEYGPTEATVWSAVHKCEIDQDEPVSIGRPIANTQIYLLDAYLSPVPIGVAGELYIGGIGLARGYQDHVTLTAERFIPNPFDAQSGGRLYRTGDLARYREDGNIEFLGRTDHQVKIRGFRIELSEIEVALLQHAQIKESIAIVREDNPEDKRLVAYVVSTESTLSIEDVRVQLKMRLPDYMIPVAFVFLESLPLTSNGKVNRKALLAPDASDYIAHEYIAPRNPIEETLANIWIEVLGVERVGINDSFFALGGHSLMVIQLMDKINSAFESDLKLRTIFNYTTIAALAQLIEQGGVSDFEDVTIVNLAKEAELDPAIQPTTKLDISQYDPVSIFLTGGTGFLGSFLLYELLQRTSADIYCLVRAKTDTEAFNKLKRNLQRYKLFNESFKDRIKPLCGDLSEPKFGFSSKQFIALASQIEVIYHNGAMVNFTQPYAALKAVNVLGTQEVLRLACAQKTKPVHYISTLSVFGEDLPDGFHSFSENTPLDANIKLGDGYSQSKWVAEQMLHISSSRGLPISIYRPATVTGHSQTGVWNTDDFLCRMIRGCIDLGEVPAKQVGFNIVPVDYVSKAIVHLSRKSDAIGKAFHLSNKDIVASFDMVDWINAFGYSVHSKPYSQWRERVLVEVAQSSDHPLYPLLSTFTPDVSDTEVTDDLVGVRERYSCIQTQEALAGSGICCPAPDQALFKIYLTYLQQNKMLAEHV